MPSGGASTVSGSKLAVCGRDAVSRIPSSESPDVSSAGTRFDLPEMKGNATPAPPPAPVSTRFRAAASWKDRKNVIADLPIDQVSQEVEFLFEVVRNRDETDAVRFEAVHKLEEFGSRVPVNSPVTSRIADLLRFEPNEKIRYGLVASLGRLIAGHQSENEYLFEVFRSVLTTDSSPSMRTLAADRLGIFFESERSLPVLRVALRSEADQETRRGIERTIRQIED
jgi:hypothetical protein